MALNTFIVYSVSLAVLLVTFVLLASWGTAQPGFDGWSYAKPNGPFWQMAQFLFMYSGIVSDVAFIRTAVVLANLFITAWAIFGVASWPNIWSTPMAKVHVDQLVWCFACVFVNALPMFRQFKFDDSRKKFCVGEDYEAMAESIWREWWRRSGVPRTDFKLLVESGEWLELSPGETLELKSLVGSASPCSEHESLEDSQDSVQDNYYYIVQGTVSCVPALGSGRKEFTLSSGYFCDAFHLMATLGQTTVCMAMQTGPTTVTVLPNMNSDEETQGAIVIKWTHEAIVSKILNSHGFAPLCLKTVVSSATLDSLYREAVTEATVDIYDMVEARRKELVRNALPKNAAMPQRPFWKQFWMSHISWRDLWEPSPHQRVVNAITTGSREIAFLREVQEARESLFSMRQFASEALSMSTQSSQSASPQRPMNSRS